VVAQLQGYGAQGICKEVSSTTLDIHMFVPNLYTKQEKETMYGLHKFADGAIYLVTQHPCGDWMTLRPASEHEEKYFAANGVKVPFVKKEKAARVETTTT
jgi:hypothetical protein